MLLSAIVLEWTVEVDGERDNRDKINMMAN